MPLLFYLFLVFLLLAFAIWLHPAMKINDDGTCSFGNPEYLYVPTLRNLTESCIGYTCKSGTLH